MPSCEAIMNQVREVSQSNPALIDALIAALKDLKPARPSQSSSIFSVMETAT